MRSLHRSNRLSTVSLLVAMAVSGSGCTFDLVAHPCVDDTDCPGDGYCDNAGQCVIRIAEPEVSTDGGEDYRGPDGDAGAAHGLTARPTPETHISHGIDQTVLRDGSGESTADTGETLLNTTDDTNGEADEPTVNDRDDDDESEAGPAVLDGEHCEAAVALTLGRNQIDTTPYLDDYSAFDGSCHGVASNGPDMVGSITVPARTRLELSLEATDFEAMVAVSRGCSRSELACIAGSFPAHWAPDFVNLTEQDVEVFVIIDGHDGTAGTGVLVAAFSDIGTTAGDSLYSAIGVDLGFLEAVAYHGDTSSYSNAYTDYSAIDGYLSCCDSCAAPGNDAVFRIAAPDVPHDYFVRAGLGAEFEATLALAKSSSASPTACELTQGSWVQHYQRESSPDVSSFWVIVDGADAGSVGTFDIGFSVY